GVDAGPEVGLDAGGDVDDHDLPDAVLGAARVDQLLPVGRPGGGDLVLGVEGDLGEAGRGVDAGDVDVPVLFPAGGVGDVLAVGRHAGEQVVAGVGGQLDGGGVVGLAHGDLESGPELGGGVGEEGAV